MVAVTHTCSISNKQFALAYIYIYIELLNVISKVVRVCAVVSFCFIRKPHTHIHRVQMLNAIFVYELLFYMPFFCVYIRIYIVFLFLRCAQIGCAVQHGTRLQGSGGGSGTEE